MSEYVEDICFYRKAARFVLEQFDIVRLNFRLRYFDKMAAINHH